MNFEYWNSFNKNKCIFFSERNGYMIENNEKSLFAQANQISVLQRQQLLIIAE